MQREEASIIRQIRQFLGSSKKNNNYFENNEKDETNAINAYFGL